MGAPAFQYITGLNIPAGWMHNPPLNSNYTHLRPPVS